ncbi:uncharacterized protein J8A68_001768 [[Candida] subhashii]|uniref:Chromatin structure-remodeling complex protein RSC58 n=1 Tax=[Candida] subhashii TaxID=561895 RepID=A0A8J5QT21_9ASCO|nr:uncharacterized protein J8A68_001768 [[Candida] subhashii]KAG7664672.1 hypothetical protein J8A68_001768 [[Candida] subhashii]
MYISQENYLSILVYERFTNFVVVVEFERILPDLFTVYENADKELNVLSSDVLPVDFHEDNSMDIVQSHKTFVDSKGPNVKTTTINQKYQDKKYTSPYELYHDIKIVCSVLLNNTEVGSKEYKELDFFYKFTTEILLREVGSIIVFNNPVAEVKSELETQLQEDFDKIITSYNISNGEVITYISKTEEQEPQQPYSNLYANQSPVVKQRIQPLFSSVINKSELDSNRTIVPDPFSVSKVVPIVKDSARSESVLDQLTPISNKIPSPLEASSSQILHDFFHPTWYTINVPTWLTYKAQTIKPTSSFPLNTSLISNNAQGQKPKLAVLQQREADSSILSVDPASVWGSGNSYRSFAPRIDSKESIIGGELKGRIWLHHIGISEIEKIKQKYFDESEKLDDIEMKDEEVEVEEGDQEVEGESKPNGDNMKDTQESEDIKVEGVEEEKPAIQEEEESPITDINIANLVQWDPSKLEELNYLKELKQDIVKPVKLQKLICNALLKLNKLRQERYLKSDIRNPLTPNQEEVKLYHRIQKFITLAIQLYKISPQTFSYEFSQKIPVLVSEFNGTLPGIAPTRLASGTSLTKPGRLPSINKLSKKKRY